MLKGLKKPKNISGAEWGKEAEEQLRDLWGTNDTTAREVSKITGRSITACRRKAGRLGLIKNTTTNLNCLRCGHPFRSRDKARNRICQRCKNSEEFLGALPYSGVTTSN